MQTILSVSEEEKWKFFDFVLHDALQLLQVCN